MKRIVNGLLIMLLCSCLVHVASANTTFTNVIELSDSSIELRIHEIYTDDDARGLREELDVDKDKFITTAELDKFREQYLSDSKAMFLEYVLVNNGSTRLDIESVELGFEAETWTTDDASMNVTCVVRYALEQGMSDEKNTIWVMGHPLIESMRFMIPGDMEVVSYDGLNEAVLKEQDGKVVLEGASGIRSFMNGDKQRMEYAAFVVLQKEPFYKNRFFLPLLAFIELVLLSIALYIIRKNKSKKTL